jgi:mannobiose 2-epimerase
VDERIPGLLSGVKNNLENGIIPFWLERAADREFGGFLTNFDGTGAARETPEKYLNSQCRQIWWFSRLHRARPDLPGCAELAAQGVDFLLRFFWDAAHGGWHWKIGRDGSRLDDGKVVYGQSFAIYALAEYALSTGSRIGLDYAARTFELLQLHCADTRYGGYYENLERDWQPAAGGFHAGDRKGLDTHMHLMEAFTVLYQASGEAVHRRKLLELVELIGEKMVDKEHGCGRNQFDRAFNPIPATAIRRTWNAERLGEAPEIPTDTTSYGHNVELVWLMERALHTAGASLEPYLPLMRKALDHAAQWGVDWEQGGIYRDGTAAGGALVREKEWWQHAESLVGFLAGYAMFEDSRYLDACEAIWHFVEQHFIVAGVGEWRTLLTREGAPIDGDIGNPWKVAYHTGRSMLECSERLEDLASYAS